MRRSSSEHQRKSEGNSDNGADQSDEAVRSTSENSKATAITELIKNFRDVRILKRRKNSYRYPIPGKNSTRVPPPKASRNFGENCTPTARKKKKPILGPLRIRYAGHYTYRYSRQAEKSLKTNSKPHACDSGVPFPATCRYRHSSVIAAFWIGLRGQEPRERVIVGSPRRRVLASSGQGKLTPERGAPRFCHLQCSYVI